MCFILYAKCHIHYVAYCMWHVIHKVRHVVCHMRYPACCQLRVTSNMQCVFCFMWYTTFTCYTRCVICNMLQVVDIGYTTCLIMNATCDTHASHILSNTPYITCLMLYASCEIQHILSNLSTKQKNGTCQIQHICCMWHVIYMFHVVCDMWYKCLMLYVTWHNRHDRQGDMHDIGKVCESVSAMSVKESYWLWRELSQLFHY